MAITEKECTGCSSCVNKCPAQCISLVKNKEGFFYPQIDTQKCTKCNLCISACPLNKNQKLENDNNKAYLAYSLKDEDRISATSGGLFGKLACNVIDNGGIVYGAAFGDDHTVQFIGAQNHEQLKRLFKSKYVQAYVGSIYNDVKKMLKSGVPILFSGTPCQVAGLTSFLGEKQYDNLLKVEIVCHGVPSPLIYRKWIKEMENTYHSKIDSIDFRKKDANGGWNNSKISVLFENGFEYVELYHKDPYMKSFLSNLYLRKSCYSCNFKIQNTAADITLGDFWDYEKFYDNIDDLGVSAVITHTHKGENALNLIANDIKIVESSVDKILEGNPCLAQSVQIPRLRSFAWKWVNRLSLKTLTNIIDKIKNSYNIIDKIKQKIKTCIKKCWHK